MDDRPSTSSCSSSPSSSPGFASNCSSECPSFACFGLVLQVITFCIVPIPGGISAGTHEFDSFDSVRSNLDLTILGGSGWSTRYWPLIDHEDCRDRSSDQERSLNGAVDIRCFVASFECFVLTASRP